MVDLKSKSWAAKSTLWKDEGFQQICSIYYFETNWKGKDKTIENINQIFNINNFNEKNSRLNNKCNNIDF